MEAPLIAALKGKRQADLYELQVTLVYRVTDQPESTK